MEEHNNKSRPFVWVTDRAGSEFLCPVDALKDPKEAAEHELDDCIDVAELEPYLDE
jgi:hypothetical protein